MILVQVWRRQSAFTNGMALFLHDFRKAECESPGISSLHKWQTQAPDISTFTCWKGPTFSKEHRNLGCPAFATLL